MEGKIAVKNRSDGKARKNTKQLLDDLMESRGRGK
jgi:hypothetical protein